MEPGIKRLNSLYLALYRLYYGARHYNRVDFFFKLEQVPGGARNPSAGIIS